MDFTLFGICLAFLSAEFASFLFYHSQKEDIENQRHNSLKELLDNIFSNQDEPYSDQIIKHLAGSYDKYRILTIPFEQTAFRRITINLIIASALSLVYGWNGLSSLNVPGFPIPLDVIFFTVILVLITMATWLGYAEIKWLLTIKTKYANIKFDI